MKKLFALLIVFVFILTGCNKTDPNKEKLLSLYPGLETTNHVYIEVTFEEAIDLVQSGTGIIIFSFPSCPYCQAVLPILNEVAIEEKVKEIYYFDIQEMRQNNTNEYQQLLTKITEQVDDLPFADDTNTTRRIVVPDVYFIKNGVIKSHHIATIKDGEGKWIKNLSEIEKNELKEIYINMINELK